MKAITVYETNGMRFDKREDAIAYEKFCNKIKSIMSQLLPRTKEIEEGTDYNKHNLDILNSCFKAFCEVCAKAIPLYGKWFIEVANGERHISHIARILGDYHYDYPILSDAYFRFSCINFENGYEFQQPYFVTHQEEFFEFMMKYGNKKEE